MNVKIIATNRKASHEYHLLETYEAGLVLQGSEIKSIRAGKISIAEAYIQIENGEAWLIEAHIAPYEQAGKHYNHDPKRKRKLLLHTKEIATLEKDVRQKGATIIPLKVYLKEGRAKLELALAKGKKLYDKRESIAKRDAQRDAERQIRYRE
ncbi:MAG: SsrA-binding protein SmpB [Anaerolineales bacterium]